MDPQGEEHQGPGVDLSIYKALYIEEARMCLTTLRQNLIQLGQDPGDNTALREAHRAAHTLKGMSATMRYESLTALASELEHPLRRADQEKLSMGAAEVKALLAGCEDLEAGLNGLDLDR
jgi:two-component system chemotaxis sensor kinase CheA